MVELIAVLFLVLIITAPFITLFLLGKYKGLRENLDRFTEENSRALSSLQKEVAGLRRQLDAVGRPIAPVAGEVAPRPAAPAAPGVKETPVPSPRFESPVPVKVPAPMSFPTSVKVPDPPLVEKPREPAHAEQPSEPIVPAGTPSQKLPVRNKTLVSDCSGAKHPAVCSPVQAAGTAYSCAAAACIDRASTRRRCARLYRAANVGVSCTRTETNFSAAHENGVRDRRSPGHKLAP
jgi:hypothetical protein